MRRALVVAALGLLALPAEAGSLTRAKRFFRQAEARFKAGDYEQASKLYQQAYEAKPLPAFFINIGQCHRKTGDCETALKYYRRYLAEDSSKRHQKKAEALIKVCEEELAARKQLEKEARPPEPQPPPTDSPQPAPQQISSRKGLNPLYFWSCVGVTGAMLLLGTVTGAIALSKSSDYKDPATNDAEAAALKDQGEDLKIASTVTFSFAIAAAVASATLYFFTDFSGAKESPPTPTPASAVMVAPLSGGAMISVGSWF